jgi:hypothetical protein
MVLPLQATTSTYLTCMKDSKYVLSEHRLISKIGMDMDYLAAPVFVTLALATLLLRLVLRWRVGELCHPSIPGHLALALWAGPSTALKSTAQARPRHGLIVLVPGTARPQCRAWASKSAHGPGPGTARFWARHDAGTTPGRRMQCDLLSTVGSRLGFHRVYILPSPDSASLTPTRTVRHRAASLSTRVRLALHSSGH